MTSFIADLFFPAECHSAPSTSTEARAFSYRTHTCGELRRAHVRERVQLYGWLQVRCLIMIVEGYFHSLKFRRPQFWVLRDVYGTVQCVLAEGEMRKRGKKVPLESVVFVEGTVVERPSDMVNANMATGVSFDLF